MPIIYGKDVKQSDRLPGIHRWERVSKELGAQGMTMGELTYTPGSQMPPHTHSNEEAMLITRGTLEAVLGDETYTVSAGDTVLAPAGVKHGFINRTSEDAHMVWVHPVTEIVMQWVD